MKRFLSICIAAALTLSIATAEAAKAKKEVVRTTYAADIDCGSCVGKIMNTIPFQRGVKDVKVDLPNQSVDVTYDVAKQSSEELVASFAKIGIEVKEVEVVNPK